MSPTIKLVEWGPQTPNCWKQCVRAHTCLTHNHRNISIKPCRCCRKLSSGPTLHEDQGVTRSEFCNFHVSLPPKFICSIKHHKAIAIPRMNSQIQGTSVCTGTLGDGFWGNYGFSTRFDCFSLRLPLTLLCKVLLGSLAHCSPFVLGCLRHWLTPCLSGP